MARDPLLAVIGMQSAAAIPLGPSLGLIKIHYIFTPRSPELSPPCRPQTAPVTETNRNSPVTRPEPAHVLHMEDQNIAIYTQNEANFV